ncbi:MAG TPA: LysR family transcriptional regulator [Steroidobacteraceae bacterium]|nr:LysR family transcriptional regulator [Steroidobacteraceae bacterium]
MSALRSSVEQWQVLAAVVDEGGFAQAAQRLHRSQSAISYAMAQLQESLGVRLLEMQGRRAVLTTAGAELLRRSRAVVEQFAALESLARAIDKGWESELKLVVDAAFPQQRLLGVLAELRVSCADTTISLADAVLSGAEDAIVDGAADVVVTTRVPQGFLGDWLMDVEMVAVAAPSHPLHALHRTLSLEDLVLHTQAVVRDSGRQPRDEGWLGAQHRWTVASLEASHAAVRAGLAYAWLPAHLISSDIASAQLKPLPLTAGGTRHMSLYVVLVRGDTAGPAARKALELLQRHLPATPVSG